MNCGNVIRWLEAGQGWAGHGTARRGTARTLAILGNGDRRLVAGRGLAWLGGAMAWRDEAYPAPVERMLFNSAR